MKKINALIFIISILVLSACGSSNTPVPYNATPTETKPIPTATITLTYTPSPTSTVTPTPTPQPITSANIDEISEDFQIGVGTISDISWLPDGNLAVTHSVGVSIYNAQTLKLIKIVQPINKVSLSDSVVSHNGKYVASRIDNQTIQVWDINSGETTYEISAKCDTASSNRIAFNYDDTKLFTCDEDGVSVWELSDLKKLSTFVSDQTTKGFIRRIVVNPEDNYLAANVIVGMVGNPYEVIIIWNITTGEVEKTFRSTSFSSMAFSHNGTMLAFADQSKVTIYEMSNDRIVNTIDNSASSIEFSNDDKVIAIGGNYYNGTKFVDITTGKIVSVLENIAARIIRFSPDGSRLAIGSNDVSVWRTTDNVNYRHLGKTEFFNPYLQVVFDSKNKYLAVGGNGAFIALWDLEKKAALEYVFSFGGNFIFDPTGTSLVTRAWNENNWWGSIQSWNLKTRASSQFEDVIEVQPYTSLHPLFCPEDNCLAVGNENQQIKFWDKSSYKLLFTLVQPSLSDYEFSPNGAFFASSGDNQIIFWNLKAQEPILTIYTGKPISNIGGPIYDISFSPSSKLIAWAGREGVVILETDGGQLANEFKDIKEAKKVVFSPRENIIGALGYDSDNKLSIFVWDITNNNLLYKIPSENSNDESKFLFSPDGSLLVTHALSEHVQFWDANSGELFKTLDWFTTTNYNISESIAFTSDGRRFAAITADGTVKIFQIFP